MSAHPPISIPRLSYGLKLGAVVAAGLLVGIAAAAALGGDRRAIGGAAVSIAIGSMLTFLPAVLPISAAYWGVAVLVSGLARSIMILAVGYTLVQGETAAATRPLLLGAASGAAVILIAESALAIRALARWDHERLALKNSQTRTAPCP